MARVVCVVRHAPDRVDLTWSDGPDSFPTYALTGQTARRFAARLSEPNNVRDRLRDLVAACLDSPATFDTPDVRQAALALAQAGFELRRLVFAPNDDPGKSAGAAAAWLTQLHARNAVESLEVIADGGPPVPWSLLYESKPDATAFLSGPADGDHWRGFWGLRFNLAGGQRVDPRRRLPWWTEPRLVLVVDPQVRDGLPEAMRARLDAFAAARNLPLVGSRSGLEAALADGRPDLLYWLGHTSPDALVLGDGPGSEIRPNDLLDLLAGTGDEPPGGLVFLNACRTAEGSATEGSFACAVFEKQMSGLIATEQQTIDTFAAPLGLDFLEAFLDRGESVGAAMRTLRARVPLGLVYGTYCPPDIRVVRLTDVTDAVPVTLAAAEAGVSLGTAARKELPLPPHPYRSLRAYGAADRALFAGRDDDVLRFATVLDDPAARVVLLHGESGVGKTSFLQAGVIPYLETECVGYRFARDRGGAVLLVRATNDPVTQLAAALAAFCAAPFAYRTPDGRDVSADLPGVLGSHADLRAALTADAGLLGHILAGLAAALPFTPVLVIDQAEEVFTLARTAADEANRAAALEMLRRAASGPGGFKVVVSLRTEYHGRFADQLRRGARDTSRDYLLTDFDRAALTAVILRPTARTTIPFASEIPAEKYRFRYAAGVAEAIAGETRAFTRSRQDSALPLVQVICSQLYERVRRRPNRTVTAADLAAVSGVAGGMRAHAEALLVKLFPVRGDREAFRRLLAAPESQMFVRQPDGTLTTALVSADFLAGHWKGRAPFADALKLASGGEWRLLRVNSLRIGADAQERPYVSLGHDALAGVVAGWADELKRQAQSRRQQRIVAGLVFGLLALVAVAAGLTGLTVWAFKQRSEAEQARDRAERERYVTTVRAAAQAWDAGRHDEAAALLNPYHPAVNPTAHDRGHVGWEWHFLWRRTRLATPLLRGHVGTAELALNPAGDRLATCGDDDVVRVWDARTGRQLWRWAGKLDFPRTLSFSPDGKRLACGNLTQPGQGAAFGVVEVRDGTMVWDAADGEELTIGAGGRFDWAARPTEARTADRAYRAFPDGTVRVTDTRAPPAVVSVTVGAVRRAAVSPDRRHAVLFHDAGATVVDTATGRPLGRIADALVADFSGDGLVTAGADRAVVVRDTAGAERARIDAGEDVAAVALSADGGRVAALTRSPGRSERRVRVWDVATRRETCALGPAAFGPRLAFVGDGLVTLTPAAVAVWDADTGTRRAELVSTYSSGEASTVRGFAVSADRTRLLVVDSRTTWLFDPAKRSALRKWPVRAGADGVLGANGRVVVFAWPDRSSDEPGPASVSVCDPDGGGVFTLSRQLAPGFVADVSPDGSRLLTADAAGVRLWELRGGTEVLTLEAGAAWFTADGRGAFGVAGDEFRTWDGSPVGR